MSDREIIPTTHNFIKLSFKLTDEQMGPFPVSVESLWCESEGIYYRVKNAPFFIDGISFDDLIAVSKIDDHLYRIDSVEAPSKNSTIWVYSKDEVQGGRLLESLNKLGCGIEGGVFPDYYAVNVPGTTDLDFILKILNDAESSGWIACDYPSIRQE
jgi:hypothetical protein